MRLAAMWAAGAMMLAHSEAFLAPGGSVGWATRANRASVSMMATLEPGSTCLVLGSGPLHLLTAKQAALAGYQTCVFTAQEPSDAIELIYDDIACPKGSLPLTFLDISNKEKCEEAIQNAESILLVTDGESTVTDFAIDAVLPEDEPTKVKKIVAMSRNLNGKGLGFFTQSAKDFANPDVWTGSTPIVDVYRKFEAKIRAKAAKVGADYTIVRSGTLKGGGPGAELPPAGSKTYPHAAYALSSKFYLIGMVPRPNWKMLFDCDTQGVELVPGDRVEGPGFFAVKASVNSGVEKGDSGRLGVAAAMVQSLAQEKAANTDFAVVSASNRSPPSQSDWDSMFAAL